MIIQKNVAPKQADDFIRIQDIWGMVVPRWHWFVLSIALTMGLATLYLMKTPDIYTRTASILVKDDSKSGNAGGAGSEFSDLGIFKSNTNINNELFTLKSPMIMVDVVKRLGLDESYVVRRGLKHINLYKENPVMVSCLGSHNPLMSFGIRITDDHSFTLTDIVIDGRKYDDDLTGHIGDSIACAGVSLVLSHTSHWSDSYIGTTVRYAKGDVNHTADAYAAGLRADLNTTDATIINLSIDDASIRKAEDILNTVIQVYNEKWIQDKNQIAISTSQFIGERLSVIENELGNVDDDISSFKSEHLLPDVQAASSMYMAQSAANKKELSLLNSQLSTAKFIRSELLSKKLDQLLPTNSGIASANIESQISEYNAMVLNRNRLLANSSEKNPLVKDLTSSLQSMQNTIIQSVDNLLVSLNTQIRDIRKQQEATTSQLASNPSQAKYLLSVERQQKVKEELYLYLLQKREENELSQAFTAYNTRVINSPRGSMLPTAPIKRNILAIAFVIGLLIPSVIIFLKESLNSTVRGRKDLESMSVPLLGEIPFCESQKRSRKKKAAAVNPIVVQAGSRNVVNEAFRVLRSNIDFMVDKNSTSHVFVVTSFNPGSGKSFLSANMAISFALKGQRVLIIDGDMRHASMSAYLNSPQTGLSHYLSGQTDQWQSLIKPVPDHDTLFMLPVGTLPPNPTELLENGRLHQLIAELRQHYDYIFIDCPPIDIVADTRIIATEADRTFFVIRVGLLDRSMLAELETIYSEKRFANLGMVLNGTLQAKGRYSYRYGYRYGYHYGYHSESYYGNAKS